MGLTEEGGKVITATVESMKSSPLAIALLVVNIGFLAFAAFVLGEVAQNAQERNRTQMELIGNLVKEIRDCTREVDPPKKTGGVPGILQGIRQQGETR